MADRRKPDWLTARTRRFNSRYQQNEGKGKPN